MAALLATSAVVSAQPGPAPGPAPGKAPGKAVVAPPPATPPAAPPATAAAPAAPAAPAGQTDADAVRSRMEKGQGFFVEKKFAEALEVFESGYAEFRFSAFLYNAAVAAEKARDRQRAIARYNEFLAAVPDAPDAPEIRKKIAELEQELSAPPPTDAVVAESQREEMRSLVLVESAPTGAPVSIYERIVATAAPFQATKTVNPGWRRVATGLKTPADVSLKVGVYQVVVEGFADYNLSDSRISLEPGTLFKFRANLSQGEFLGSLEVKSPAKGALIYVDDPPPHKNAAWGEGSTTKKVTPGERQITVEAPGYLPFTKTVRVDQGKTATLDAALVRVDYGYLVVDGNAFEVTVEVDGEPVGLFREGKDPVKIKLPAGRHYVEIDADGKKAWEGELIIPKGQELPVHARLEDTPGKGHALVASLFGLGAIGGGIGLLSLASAKEKSSADGAEDSTAQAARPVGIAVLIGGGAITGLSIFFWAYDPSEDTELKEDRAREFRGREAVIGKPPPKDKAEGEKSSLAPRRKAPRETAGPSIGLVPSFSDEFGGAFLQGRF